MSVDAERALSIEYTYQQGTRYGNVTARFSNESMGRGGGYEAEVQS